MDVQGVTTKFNYALGKVHYPSPVKVGSRIRLVAKPASAPGTCRAACRSPMDGTLEIEIEEGGGKPAALLRSPSRFYA